MILYNVWFSFKSGCNEPLELEKVRAFLDDLKARSKVQSYRLLKNRAPRGKRRLCPYQIVAEFKDGDQFGLPFAEVEHVGVHSGRHGTMIENVDEFVVEVFDDI